MKVSSVLTALFLVATSDYKLVADASPVPAPEPGRLEARQCYVYVDEKGVEQSYCNDTPTCGTNADGSQWCVAKREAAPEPEPAPLQKRSAEPEPAPEPNHRRGYRCHYRHDKWGNLHRYCEYYGNNHHSYNYNSHYKREAEPEPEPVAEPILEKREPEPEPEPQPEPNLERRQCYAWRDEYGRTHQRCHNRPRCKKDRHGRIISCVA